MGQEIGNELDEQNGKNKVLPHFYVRLGFIFFSPHTTAPQICPQIIQRTLKVYVQAATADSAHSSADFISLTPSPVGCVQCGTLGVFPKPDF